MKSLFDKMLLLYDLDNVPDNLYDLDNVPKAEGLRCVRILENIAREWQNLDEKMPRNIEILPRTKPWKG